MPLSKEGSGGAGKFIQGLIPELAKKSEVFLICSKHNANEYQFDSVKKIFEINNFDELNISETCKEMDVFFIPSNKLSPLNLPIDIPVITVIHDLQHNHYPHYFPKGGFEARNKDYGFAISRSDALVAISNWEKLNFEKYFKVRNIRTIYHAPYLYETKTKKNTQTKTKIENLTDFSSFYLYPAIPWAHKNHYNLIEAFHILNKKNKNFNLILTGSEHVESTSLLYKKIQELHAEDYCSILGYVSDDDLITLMTNAKGLVFPSLYEGFGIPVIDAMRFGIPVIASNLTSIPEITSNTINFFENPLNSFQIASDIKRFDEKITSNNYEKEKAIEIAKNYSTERLVSEYLDYFESVKKLKTSKDPNNASYSTKDISLNRSPNKITLILDFEKIEPSNIQNFVNDFINSAKPEIFDYNFIMSYELGEKYEKLFNEITKFTNISYYLENVLASKVHALEHLLEISIKTDYFFCLDADEFNNLDYLFLRKSVSVLDYFEDCFSCNRKNQSYFPITMDRPSDEEASIREFNKTLNNTETILSRFYNRLIRTDFCRHDGMIGTVPSLSKDTSTYSNITL
jgi:glycosyltransferase involved in cell wall biosynthesis